MMRIMYPSEIVSVLKTHKYIPDVQILNEQEALDALERLEREWERNELTAEFFFQASSFIARSAMFGRRIQ